MRYASAIFMADEIDEWGLARWPAAERNKAPILEQLVALLAGRSGTFLEIAAATGQHAAHFASSLSTFDYQPTDLDAEHLATLRRRVEVTEKPNLRPPVRLDVTESIWPLSHADVIYCANMVHIAPWSAAVGLLSGAARLLGNKGLLILYGPYKFDGQHTSESNERFDESLRSRNPAWGVRDVNDLSALAEPLGLRLRAPIAMPSNNFLLVFDRVAQQA